MNILYEDNHLIVVEKPVNLPVQADASGDLDLLCMVRQYIKESCHKPGEAFAALVHRLDRPVGGVMVFARTSKAAARLTAQFKGRETKKRYAAVVEGQPPAEGYLTDWLLKDEKTHSSRVVPEGTPGAKQARLFYQVLARGNDQALIDVELFTGRPHQIRVQLANAGHPLKNDQRYNPAARPGDQIALWSYALTLRHPTLNEEMTFFSAPKGEAFRPFAAPVKLLPAFSACRGVYEDADLLVVDKNDGTEVETELLSELSTLVPGLRAVHRLDANTRGLVAFARNDRTEQALLSAFRQHGDQVKKLYHALILGRPEPAGHLVHWGRKDPEQAHMQLVPEGSRGALRMELRYRLLASDGERSLVEIELLTGRTHQIRVQFAAIGHPLLGDDKYGDRQANRRFKARQQQLLAKELHLMGKRFISCRELRL